MSKGPVGTGVVDVDIDGIVHRTAMWTGSGGRTKCSIMFRWPSASFHNASLRSWPEGILRSDEPLSCMTCIVEAPR